MVRKTRGSTRKVVLVPLALALVASAGYWLLYPTDTNAFGAYLANIPNSGVNSCNTCHGTGGPGSATSNNAFKNTFGNATNNHNWSAAFAALDSDGDGFTNGEELQDPSGAFMVGQMNPGNSALVSNPSDVNSFPPAPTMTALMGLSNNATLQGSVGASVALSTTANGSPVGITRVDYIFKTAGTQTVIKTFTSTTAAAFAATLDTTTLANGAYDVTATCFDKRAAGSGGPRTASLSVTNLTVANKPKITTQPVDQLVAPNGTATFTIAATGAVSFQWRKNGSNLTNAGHYSGVTTTTLTISTAAAADAALYDCVVTNTAGSTTSITATLVVGGQTSNSYVKLVSATPLGASGTGSGSSVPPTIGSTQAVTSTNRTISTDGRYITFRSFATDLVTNHNVNQQDVFVRDLRTSTTQLVSAIPDNSAPGNSFSDDAIISADGRVVVFNSQATNLLSFGLTSRQRCYRRDLQTGVTTAIGVKSGAVTQASDVADFNTQTQAVSQDGRYVLFFHDGSTALDPTKPTVTSQSKYYLRDCVNNTTTLVTVNSAGTGTPTTGGGSFNAVMSADGRFVAFDCNASDLGPGAGVGNGTSQIWLWDRQNPNGVVLVSSADGTTTTPGTTGASTNPVINSDGHFVAFQSAAKNLNANATAGTNTVIFRRDTQTNATKVASEAKFPSATAEAGNASGCSISQDGRYVVFVSDGTNFVAAADTNGSTDIFRRDMNDATATKTIVVSAINGGNSPSATMFANSQNARISDDGRFVAFESNATDLVTFTDSNAQTDVFRRDCQTSSTILLSIKNDLTQSGNSASQFPELSGNGFTAMFSSSASDLVANDTNGATLDVFSATFNVAPTITLPATANVTVGSVFAQAGSFTDPNGPDTFTGKVDYDDGNGPQTLTLSAANTFNLSNTFMTTGVKNVKVTIIDSANGNSTSTIAVTVNPLPPPITLGSSANPAGFQQSITYTATLTATPPPVPTGVVTFSDGGLVLGSAAVTTVGSATTASFSISTLSAGSHSITAIYSGDANFGTTTSAALTQVINPSLPVITSPATATATVGQGFSYQITANGSQPITYTLGGLPTGLTFDTDTISGIPTQGGITSFRITATNSAGTITKNVVLTITRTGTGANTAPVIASAPIASPNPGSTGSPVTLVATATDADNDAILYTWDFGDGTTDFGSPITHTYTAAGVYSVTLTVSDGIASVTSGVMVAVNDSGPGGPTNTALTVTKGTLKFNFKSANSDALSLAGTIPIGAGFKPNGKSVTVIIGSFAKQFSFDAKGKSALKLTGKKAKDGSFTSPTLKFSLSLTKTSIFAGVSSLGFTNADIKTAQTISGVPVILNVGGSAFLATLKASYKAAKGKSGTATLKP